MQAQPIPGANYGEAWPDGTLLYAPGHYPPAYPSNFPMFLRGWPGDGRVASKDNATANIYLWRQTEKWTIVYTGNTPNNPVAFHPSTGYLYLMLGDGIHVYDLDAQEIPKMFIAGHYGSNGIRQVNADGTIQYGDATYGDGVVSEYTDCGDVRIGQGHDGGGIVAIVDGTPRLIVAGAQQFVRANRVSDAFGIYGTDMKQGWPIITTRAELAALPPITPPVTIGPTTPARTPSAQRYDLGTFLLTDPDLQPRSGPTHPQHQIDMTNGLIHFVKFGNPQAYETWGLDDQWLYHLEDASGNPTYSLSDPRWSPRHMPIGENKAFITGPHEIVYRERSTCQAPQPPNPINRKMWLHAVWDGWQWGASLGIRPTIMFVYDNTAGIHTSGRMVEVYYFADGAGWCRWEAHRSDLVYANGPAEFTDASRVNRSDFYLVGPPDPAVALTGCVPQVLPTPPPPIPEGDFMAYFTTVDPTKVVVAYAVKPASQAGCFNLFIDDAGEHLSAHGDTRGPNNPAGPGLGAWEAFQPTGAGIYTAWADDKAWAYGVVLTDKLPK